MRREILVLYVEEDLQTVSEVALAFKEASLASGGKIKLRHVAFLEDAEQIIAAGDVDVVLFGVGKDDDSFFDKLSALRELAPDLPVLATGTDLALELVKQIVKAGAKLYLPRPLKPRRLAAIIESCVVER